MGVYDAIKAAQGAGFEGDDLVEIVAISGLESGWDHTATHDTREYSERRDDGLWYVPGTDRHLDPGVGPEYSVGPLQINLNYWQNIEEWQARWWPTAFAWARDVFTKDGDFHAWSMAEFVGEAERNVVRHALTQAHTDALPTSLIEGKVYLNAIQSTRTLQAMWQLVANGAHLSIRKLDDGRTIDISMAIYRDDLIEAGPELQDFLP